MVILTQGRLLGGEFREYLEVYNTWDLVGYENKDSVVTGISGNWGDSSATVHGRYDEGNGASWSVRVYTPQQGHHVTKVAWSPSYGWVHWGGYETVYEYIQNYRGTLYKSGYDNYYKYTVTIEYIENSDPALTLVQPVTNSYFGKNCAA